MCVCPTVGKARAPELEREKTRRWLENRDVCTGQICAREASNASDMFELRLLISSIFSSWPHLCQAFSVVLSCVAPESCILSSFGFTLSSLVKIKAKLFLILFNCMRKQHIFFLMLPGPSSKFHRAICGFLWTASRLFLIYLRFKQTPYEIKGFKADTKTNDSQPSRGLHLVIYYTVVVRIPDIHSMKEWSKLQPLRLIYPEL